MELYIIGAFLFVLIGMVLSLMGSGGALLTIPVLVYVFNVNPYWATSYSMFIMGISNWSATVSNIKDNLINYRVGLFFAVPALIVTFTIRRYILPFVPDIIFGNEFLSISKGSAIMIILSILIFYTAIKTIKSKVIFQKEPMQFSPKTSIIQGSGIGIITGFAGAGGGFLIVPALLFSVKMPMKEAVATSLFIISITTSLGFLGDLNPAIQMNWPFLFFCTVFSITGILAVNSIKDRFSDGTLKVIFGYFLLGLSVLVLLTELSKL